jgi:hypothetical protein
LGLVEARSVVTDGNFENTVQTYTRSSNPTAAIASAMLNSIGKRLSDRNLNIV